jgi:hypothetical protein
VIASGALAVLERRHAPVVGELEEAVVEVTPHAFEA